jgi:hypothetical protein
VAFTPLIFLADSGSVTPARFYKESTGNTGNPKA